MSNVIKYLEDYIALLEGQKSNREPYYSEYVDKKKALIEKEIDKLLKLE